MRHLLTFCGALAFVAAAGSFNEARAHSPEELARRCAAAVNATVERCTKASAKDTRECVQKIRRLLQAGNREGARRVAAACIEKAENRAEACGKHVRRICNACIKRLRELNQPQLARRVATVCSDALEKLRSNLAREKRIIRAALNGNGGS